jgi:hypothetical protein
MKVIVHENAPVVPDWSLEKCRKIEQEAQRNKPARATLPAWNTTPACLGT